MKIRRKFKEMCPKHRTKPDRRRKRERINTKLINQMHAGQLL